MKYLSYLKLELLSNLQYRSAALAGIATQFFWGTLLVCVYTAFYSHASIDSINYDQLITYVWLNQAFFALIFIRNKDKDIFSSIRTGTVAYELCRPYDLYIWWYVKLLSKKYAATILRFLPIIVVALFLPKPYNLSLPISLLAFILFLISMFLGSLVVCAINLIAHFLTFFTMHDKGIFSILNSIAELLAGFDLPIPLLPAILIMVSEYLPFRLIGDLPFRIYSGNIDTLYALKSIGLQIIWIIALTILGHLIMKKALKKVCIQGG